ncbi:hypothetical protein NC652_026883 [Populus alba x Populus x berolinensis]|nr:hypothetical protein NC652_026883 [Populus alba x Populus x berolinensis]
MHWGEGAIAPSCPYVAPPLILTIRIPRIIPAVQRTGLRELEAETSLEGPKPRDTATGQPESGKKGSKRLLQGDPSPEKKRKGKLLKRQRIGIS